MKKIISIIFCATLLFASCGNNESKEKEVNNDKDEQLLNETEKSQEVKVAKNCDEFVDDYEEWMDDYLKLLDNYIKNPMDASLSQKFMEQSQKATFWTTEWNGKLYECAAQEKYQKRFDEITEKSEKKLEEMDI